MIDVLLGVPLPRRLTKPAAPERAVLPAQRHHARPTRLAVGASVACMALGLCAVVIGA